MLQHALRDLYRALKLMNSVEKDETVLCHVRLALAMIDAIMASFLMLEKIHVIDSPSDCF